MPHLKCLLILLGCDNSIGALVWKDDKFDFNIKDHWQMPELEENASVVLSMLEDAVEKTPGLCVSDVDFAETYQFYEMYSVF